MKNYLNNIGKKSKNAFKNLGNVSLKKRNKVLETYIKSLKKAKLGNFIISVLTKI